MTGNDLVIRVPVRMDSETRERLDWWTESGLSS